MTERDPAREVSSDPTVMPTPRRPQLDSLVTSEFISFYREYVPSLVGFLIFQGAQLVDAAEIAQDTMIKAFRRWSEIDSPKAWCRRVASRELVRRSASLEEPADLAPADTPLLPHDLDVSAWEERHAVLAALAALPPRQRQVMAWSYDGYTPTEIARELGIDPAAVRASLRKARRALALHLRRDDEGGAR